MAITVAAYAIYIWQTTRRRGVRPHPFSWFLWGFVTAVAFLVQQSSNGGPGSWVTGLTATVCFFIAGVSLVRNKWRFTRFDWVGLGIGLIVFGFYLIVREPKASAVLATATDVIGYGPTIKKGWFEPWRDSITSFTLNSIKFVPSLFALNSYSLATWLYPLTLVIVNAGVAFLLFIRRHELDREVKAA